MKKILSAFLFLLICFSFFISSTKAKVSTNVLELYFQEIDRKDHLSASQYIYSGDLTEFREMMEFYKNQSNDKERTPQFIKDFFGEEATVDSVEKLSDVAFYSRMLEGLIQFGWHPVANKGFEILGEVKENDDMSILCKVSSKSLLFLL